MPRASVDCRSLTTSRLLASTTSTRRPLSALPSPPCATPPTTPGAPPANSLSAACSANTTEPVERSCCPARWSCAARPKLLPREQHGRLDEALGFVARGAECLVDLLNREPVGHQRVHRQGARSQQPHAHSHAAHDGRDLTEVRVDDVERHPVPLRQRDLSRGALVE